MNGSTRAWTTSRPSSSSRATTPLSTESCNPHRERRETWGGSLRHRDERAPPRHARQSPTRHGVPPGARTASPARRADPGRRSAGEPSAVIEPGRSRRRSGLAGAVPRVHRRDRYPTTTYVISAQLPHCFSGSVWPGRCAQSGDRQSPGDRHNPEGWPQKLDESRAIGAYGRGELRHAARQ